MKGNGEQHLSNLSLLAFIIVGLFAWFADAALGHEADWRFPTVIESNESIYHQAIDHIPIQKK